jgi:septum formation protein
MSLTAPTRPLILGSTSRYRRELLQRLRLPFEVVSPQVDETPQPGESPQALAERLAMAKAQAVAQHHPNAVVIGSDQVADLHGEPLGKPGDHARAAAHAWANRDFSNRRGGGLSRPRVCRTCTGACACALSTVER